MFSQLNLEARGITSKGMQHGLLGGMVQRKRCRVNCDRRTDLQGSFILHCVDPCCIIPSLCVLTAILGGERDCY